MNDSLVCCIYDLIVGDLFLLYQSAHCIPQTLLQPPTNRGLIAEALDVAPEDIWPSRYRKSEYL
ncbi:MULTISPECIES: helix-turn-helix domain-containing protein [Klebsiella]|uniref:helix-turn-helix domain-containing protein n=1 Tax=Klebsiella sp. K5-1 TaxID=2920188 RepID=UPI00098327D7|nr:helix-turn-helix domain-containing protein [Klebsiella quasipneumoniae]